VDGLNDAQLLGETLGEWVSVEAKNPSEAGRYLVLQKAYIFKSKNYKTNKMDDYRFGPSINITRLARRRKDLKDVGTLRWWASKGVVVKRITHWMQLPPLPKAKDED
jgi:hypothetical protein